MGSDTSIQNYIEFRAILGGVKTFNNGKSAAVITLVGYASKRAFEMLRKHKVLRRNVRQRNGSIY